MAAGCDYANSRVRAMRSRLLGRSGIADLLAQPGLTARLEFLKRTDYADALTVQLARDSDPLAAAEHGLRARLLYDLARIDRYLRGEWAQALFRAVLAFEDGWTLKTVLRGVATRVPPERIFLLLAPSPELDPPMLEELVRQRDVKAVVDLLTTWRSPYGRPLAEALAVYASRRELLYLDVALDSFLFDQALEVARGDGEDGRVLLGFLETRIDLVNAATLLKLAGQGGAEEFFIPGGRLLSQHRFRRYSGLDGPALRAALARDGRLLAIGGLIAVAALENPFAADQWLHRALGENIRREARRSPLSLAVPLAFVIDRQTELRRIRLVLRGADFGLPAAELLEFIET